MYYDFKKRLSALSLVVLLSTHHASLSPIGPRETVNALVYGLFAVLGISLPIMLIQYVTVLINKKFSVMSDVTVSFEQVTDVTLEDYIGDLDPEIIKLMEFVQGDYNVEKYKQMRVNPRSTGVLLYGPAGTGKTFLMRCFAGDLNKKGKKCFFCVVNGADYLDMFLGEGRKRLDQMLNSCKEYAKKNNGIVILFIDEIDAIPNRTAMTSSGTSADGGVINKLLTEIDGFNKNNNVIIVGATNYVERIDGALIREGRLNCVYIPLPTENQKEKIFEYFVNKVPTDRNISSKTLAALSKKMTPAGIKLLFEKTGELALKRNGTQREKEDFARAFLYFYKGKKINPALELGKIDVCGAEMLVKTYKDLLCSNFHINTDVLALPY
jgi:cell division protease FtsH